MASPIELKLIPRKTVTFAGEGIRLDLSIHILAGIELESPEVNRNRTSIRVQPNAPGAAERILTGADYLRIQNINPATQIGQTTHVDAGKRWSVEIKLFNFTLPLPAGRYSVSVAYLYGDSPQETVETNSVQLEVVVAPLVSAQYRWLGGSNPRELLSSIWSARDASREQWFYQLASRRDPAAIVVAVSLGSPARHPGAHPTLAHLNDIHSMHFEKYAVWEQDGEVAALKVHSNGPSGEPRFVRHGLTPGARLAEPPLQLHQGGLMVLLAGVGTDSKPMLSLISFPDSGPGTAIQSILPVKTEQILAFWPPDQRAPSLFLRQPDGRVTVRTPGGTTNLFHGTPVEALLLSQWMGTGTLAGSFRDAAFIRTFTQDALTPTAERNVLASYEIARLPSPPGKFLSAAHRDPGGVSLLFECPAGWLVLDSSQAFVIPTVPGADGTPLLMPAGKSLFLVQHHPDRGFLSYLVGAAPVESLI